MFGFACDETDELIAAADHAGAQARGTSLAKCAARGSSIFSGPMGKSQVTVEYHGDRPVRVDTVVISTTNIANPFRTLNCRDDHGRGHPQSGSHVLDGQEIRKFHINPTGRFVLAGRWADAGLNGPQDYCRYIWRVQPARGARFRAKDPSKVDRFGLLHGAARGENLVAGGRAWRARLKSTCVRDRRGRSSFGHGGDIWHRRDSRWGDHRPDSQHIQTDARGIMSRSIFGGPFTGHSFFRHFGAPAPDSLGSGPTRRTQIRSRQDWAQREVAVRRCHHRLRPAIT